MSHTFLSFLRHTLQHITALQAMASIFDIDTPAADLTFVDYTRVC